MENMENINKNSNKITATLQAKENTFKEIQKLQSIPISVYATLDEILEFIGLELNEDQQKYSTLFLNFANSRINIISSNEIERIGFVNLSDKQQVGVKKAVAWYFRWLIINGQQWYIGSASYSTQGFSISQSEPQETDYILPVIYEELLQVNLYVVRDIFKEEEECGKPDHQRYFFEMPFSPWDKCVSAREVAYHWVKSVNFSVNGTPLIPTYNANYESQLDIVLPSYKQAQLDRTRIELLKSDILALKEQVKIIFKALLQLNDKNALNDV